MNGIPHLNDEGKANMVDVSAKEITHRTATAQGLITLNKTAFEAIKNNSLSKGDALAVAKIAGIQAAKKTAELIPLCHNIFISKIDLNFTLLENSHSIQIESSAVTDSKTGIEMEALTAVSVAALTIYDMCKSVDKSMKISGIELISKTGGKSGNYSKELK